MHGNQCRFPIHSSQLTVLPLRSMSGVEELQTDRCSSAWGERPPPDPSECGRTASYHMRSAGILVVSSVKKNSQNSQNVLAAECCFDILRLSTSNSEFPLRQSASHFPSGHAPLGETHLRNFHWEDDWRKLHCFHLPALWVSWGPFTIFFFFLLVH